MKKQKLLFFINTLQGGGAEKVLVDLVNHMDSAKYDITVQTVLDSGLYRDSLAEHIRYRSIFPYNKIFSYLWSRFLSGRISPKWFYRRFIQDDYDVEIAFLEGFPTKILAASENPYKYAWVHTDLYHYYGHRNLFRTIEENRQCYLTYRKIFCVSQLAKHGFHQQFGEMDHVMVQYNPIDESTILSKSKEPITAFSYDDAHRNLIAVGRLVPQKGFDRLLRVHRRLIAEGCPHKLWIVGDGAERKTLENYILEYRLQNSATLLGFQSNPYSYIKEADALVCSSYVEGYGAVVAEAMICGTAVISVECSGVSELFGDSEYGLLVKNDEEALYQGLKTLLKSPELLQHYRVKAEERGKEFCLAHTISEIENRISS